MGPCGHAEVLIGAMSGEGAGSHRRVMREDLKRPPGNIRRPTGLKMRAFENGPVRPGYAKLALACGARRIKNAVPSKEQKTCCGEDTDLRRYSSRFNFRFPQ
jgi:hypothetical protein